MSGQKINIDKQVALTRCYDREYKNNYTLRKFSGEIYHVLGIRVANQPLEHIHFTWWYLEFFDFI